MFYLPTIGGVLLQAEEPRHPRLELEEVVEDVVTEDDPGRVILVGCQTLHFGNFKVFPDKIICT